MSCEIAVPTIPPTCSIDSGVARDRAGVVAAPEVQSLLPGRGRAQGHLVALTAGRRQHVSLVVTALAGDEEGIGTATHQIEAILMRTLAKSAGHGLGTDVGDERAGEGVDLRERATDPE